MKIHMIGIGGIGMSALAQLYCDEGHAVTGSDREASPTTALLAEKGIPVSLSPHKDNVPSDAALVVYSDAVWEDNPERVQAQNAGIRQLSYFEALGEVTKGKFTIAVAGVHGKTTTTALLTKILRDSGENPSAIIGSLVPEFGSNYVSGKKDLLVVEACEYKDHLLKLSPNILVITNLEWDHTDWFPSLSAMQDTFREAVHKVKEEGVIVADPNNPFVGPVLSGAKVPVVDYTKEVPPTLQLIGEFNEMNARAAKAAAKTYAPRLTDTDIDPPLSAFAGTWRRFEMKGNTTSGAVVYDDYAHHPTAIRETLVAARKKFPDKKITIVFHPHLYSRTRDLFKGFVEELSKADSVILVPIYPAREIPIADITSDALADEIRMMNPNTKSLHTFGEIEKELQENKSAQDIIITMGAGDVYKVADHIVSP